MTPHRPLEKYALSLTRATLFHYSLEKNIIGKEGAKALASALKASVTLQELNLRNAELRDEGAANLIALSENRSLHVLK